MSVPRRASLASGFTLVEVMLAVVLVSLVIGSTGALLWNLIERRRFVEEMTVKMRAGDMLMGALERDLMVCLAGDSQIGAGVQGSADRLRLLSRGAGEDPAVGAAIPAIRRDLQAVEYEFGAAEGVVYTRRWSIGRERGEGPERAVMAGGVALLSLRYFDGRSWLSEFDSLDHGGLPRAVEVRVWFGEGGTGEPDRVRVISVPDSAGRGGL